MVRRNAATTNDRLFSYSDFVIYAEDANSLNDHNWLTDNIVNFAVVYLTDRMFDEDREARVTLVYATHCELLKYEEGSGHTRLLQDYGVNRDQWAMFVYNDSNQPDMAYSGTHWSLILYDPNDHRLWLLDPSAPSTTHLNMPDHGRDGDISADIQQFAMKMRSYFGITSPLTIQRFRQCPQMDVVGDCGIFVIEYARIILQCIAANPRASPVHDFDFFAAPFYLRDRIPGAMNSRKDWRQVIARLTDEERGRR